MAKSSEPNAITSSSGFSIAFANCNLFRERASSDMGLTLPNPDSPMEQARALMTQKDNIESELEGHFSILKANNVTMQTPLVDPEGFPRADIDIYAVRGARVQIIELRNDLKAVMDAIGKALEGIYDPALAVPPPATPAESSAAPSQSETPKPFAKVDGVAPGSPAADAVGISRLFSCPAYD